MRILVVEDDTVLADGLTSSLKQAGHAVEWISSGEEADEMLSCRDYDLAVLDLGLPGLDGLHVLERLRGRKNTAPVLILTARDALKDRIRGLDLGADDYMTKPFDLSEFDARVRALLRRSLGAGADEIRLGPLRFDAAQRSVELRGEPIDISWREMLILEPLLRRRGRVVARERLRQGMCGYDDDVSDNAIEVYVHRLRKKLDGSGIVIRTIRGLGYLIDHADEN